MKKILFLTARFGDGHNTAAHNISAALLKNFDVTTSVIDVYLAANPCMTKFIQKMLYFSITRFPIIWKKFFDFMDRPGLLEKTLFFSSSLQRTIEKNVIDFAPDVIVSTFPLYSFFLRQLQKNGHLTSLPLLVTVITDSTVINTAWYRSGSDIFMVADQESAAVLKYNHVPAEKIKVFGFPVAPRLSTLTPLSKNTMSPWKILYLPSTKIKHAIEVIHALSELPDVQITIVTGRSTNLYRTLQQSGLAHREAIQLIGWTDQIPELLTSHHLYIGKAGGAIVHEAIAAQCPILVNHLMPGQEAGNTEHIIRYDIGCIASNYPAMLASSIEKIFSNEAAIWKRWKKNLLSLSSPSASYDIATFIMSMTEDKNR